MKNSIRFSVLLLVGSIAACMNPLNAQDVNKEFLAFTKKFEAAYNKHDDKALKEMYTKDAVNITAEGNTVTGNENIIASFLKQFADNDKIMIEIKNETGILNTDGSATATGTYHVSGKTKTGETIDVNGKYTNTSVKEKGQWKITKSILEHI